MTTDYTGKHIVVHCRTGEIWACETLEDAHALAEAHRRQAEIDDAVDDKTEVTLGAVNSVT